MPPLSSNRLRLTTVARCALLVAVALVGASGCARAASLPGAAAAVTRLSSTVTPTGVTVERFATPAPALIDAAETPAESGELITSVVLPAGYHSRRCWPVLYLLHGTQAGSQPAALQWLQLGGGALERMDIPAVVVVPGSGDSWYIDDWFGGARRPAFESWMLRDVVPFAARRLHICPGRSHHSIAGLSMGAYGAVYLASQDPGYFGSAGAFSGPLAPESPNFRDFVNPDFSPIWGPVDGFYAVGHDPTALVANLVHTRVFVGVGDGSLLAGEPAIAPLQTDETEFQQESIAWVRRARGAGVPVTFDQHAGDHSDLTWLRSLRDMLGWRPFAHVASRPANWSLSTVDSSGDAWGWRFAFPAGVPPQRVIRFAMRDGVLSVRGAGTVTLTSPAGRRLSGRIPFDVRDGRLRPTPGAPAPRLRADYSRITPVTPSVSPTEAGTSTPLTVSFTPTAPLPRGDVYQVGRVAFTVTTGGCSDNELLRIGAGTPGHALSATLLPPSSATFPGQWCQGRATVDVSEVPRTAPSTVPGTILGTAQLSIGG